MSDGQASEVGSKQERVDTLFDSAATAMEELKAALAELQEAWSDDERRNAAADR